MKKILLTLMISTYTPFIFAQKPGSVSEIESVLDRLEQNLLNREKKDLELGKIKRKKAADQNIEYQSKSITGYYPSGKKMLKLNDALRELEAEIEQLSNQVLNSKQKVMEEARINNKVILTTSLSDITKSTWRNLSVQLDGYTIYELNDSSGLWLPRKKIPLFSGPMQPGAHQIRIDGRILRRQKDQVALTHDTYNVVNQKFEINIPDGSTSKEWDIQIHIPKETEYKAIAKLIPTNEGKK